MNPNAIHVRIKRLVLEEPLSGSLSAETLTGAIRSELTSTQTESSPLARAVAGGIGERLNAMNIATGPKQGGGRNG
jgi:hypothetical protein